VAKVAKNRYFRHSHHFLIFTAFAWDFMKNFDDEEMAKVAKMT
jgi:hypothetical protein